MTAVEYRSALKRLGYTPYRAGVEGILGVTESQTLRWAREDERYPIPPYIALLLRFMLKTKRVKP